MMKIEQEPRTYLTIRAIGSGIQNVLFADPRTMEDVEECVRAVRAETPHAGGRHGVGMRRDVRVRAGRRDAGLRAGARRRRRRPDDREGLGGREPRIAAVGQGGRHGAVRPGRLLDEPRPDRPVRTIRRCARPRNT